MKQLISAQSILKQKGYVQNKFDTNGFMQAVAQYFIDNSVESRLLLVPTRFLDIDRTNEKYGNFFGITEEEEKRGYKVQTETVPYMLESIGQEITIAKFMQDLQENDDLAWRTNSDLGIGVPRIVVDKPFFENAAATLRIMGGYVVEKEMKKRRKLYWVTLV